MSERFVPIIPYCRICEAEPAPEPPSPWGQCRNCGIVDWLCDYCPTCERCACDLAEHQR